MICSVNLTIKDIAANIVFVIFTYKKKLNICQRYWSLFIPVYFLGLLPYPSFLYKDIKGIIKVIRKNDVSMEMDSILQSRNYIVEKKNDIKIIID